MAFEIRRRPKQGGKPSHEVHVAPLGWEHDRIIGPFVAHGPDPAAYKPHKLVLVVPGLEGAGQFPQKIKETLQGICEVEVLEVPRGTSGDAPYLDGVVKGVARVLARELHAGNRVFVNISGGGKLDAFAAGLAAMAYVSDENGGMYYVQPEYYAKSDEEREEHGIGVGYAGVIVVPPLSLGAPTMARVWALSKIGENGGTIDQLNLLRHMRNVPESGLNDVDFSAIDKGASRLVGGTKSEDARTRMRLKRSILDPLVEEGYLTIRKLGRKHIIKLTRKGLMYAQIAPPTSQMEPPE